MGKRLALTVLGTVQNTTTRHAPPLSRNAWTLAAVLTLLPRVAGADDAQPDAGAPAVCKPHADPKPAQKALAQARDIASSITAEYLEGSQYAMPDAVPGQLRQLAAIVECDEQAMPHWPTMQECRAMPQPICTFRLEDCRRAARERQACLDKAAIESPRATSDRLISEARIQAGRIEPLIAAEVACRASAKCLDQRARDRAVAADRAAASAACYNLQRKRDLLDSIAQEKANPAGVVDLVRLHDLGEGVQNAEADFKTAAADYQAKQHKPFRESLCR